MKKRILLVIVWLILSLSSCSAIKDDTAKVNYNKKDKNYGILNNSADSDLTKRDKYEQFLGEWYYTPYSDPRYFEDFTKVVFTKKAGRYYVKWEEPYIDNLALSEEIVFISENVAEGTILRKVKTSKGTDMDNNPIVAGMHMVNQYIFYSDEHFNLHPKIEETGKLIMMQPGQGYRGSPKDMPKKSEKEDSNNKLPILGTYTAFEVVDGKPNYYLSVTNISGNNIAINICWLGSNNTPVYVTTARVSLTYGYGIFEWSDNWMNSGIGTVNFSEESVYLTMRISRRSPVNNSTLECERTLNYRTKDIIIGESMIEGLL